MPTYKVFLKAPTAAELRKIYLEGADGFEWQIAKGPLVLSDRNTDDKRDSLTSLRSSLGPRFGKDEPLFTLPQDRDGSSEWILPPATLNAATRRISEMYKNVIFADEDEGDENEVEDSWAVHEEESGRDDTRLDAFETREESRISWAPTPDDTRAKAKSHSHLLNVTTQFETQDTDSVSYAHTSTSSIMAFPTFTINLHTLSSLSSVTSVARIAASKSKAGGPTPRWSQKVHLLVAVLEVDGPDVVVIKKGPDAGKEVSILKLILGDESGAVCKLTAWREVAERWGGMPSADDSSDGADGGGVQRGDIAYLENVLASLATQAHTPDKTRDAAPAVALTASPNLASRLSICYRTLPSAPSDRRLRPDLRLAASDPGVRKVASVVAWLESAVGLSSE